jgi:aminomethyltransferase
MGVPSPFHTKTAALCTSMRWREWAGVFAAEKYDTVHDNEYVLFRQSAGVFDCSPLFKYDISGPDVVPFLSRLLARDPARVKINQAAYCCWCDEDGSVIDDGNLFRLGETRYRLTSANATLRWLVTNSRGFDVQIDDVSEKLASLAIQGPTSRACLQACCDAPLDSLKYFFLCESSIAGAPVTISRTGYTGDLGYEVWMAAEHAEQVYEAIMQGGRIHGIGPAGLLALDIVRIEAGYIMADVDYTGSHHALIQAQKSTPFELGLGWTVHLDRPNGGWFVGQEALLEEKINGSKWSMVGLEIDYSELEALYDAIGLPTHVPTTAWRTVVPIYDESGHRQIGRASSGVFSPLLKRNLALATVDSRYAAVGTRLLIDTIVEFDRHKVSARVVDRPFFDPPRKKAVLSK